jgi:hypothetical protein
MEDERGNPRERRERLRSLDLPLLGEFESAGALSRENLEQEVERLKRLDIEAATIKEWWWYALRRRLIVAPEHPAIAGEHVLSSRGEDRLAQAIAESAGPGSEWEKKALSRVITFVAPSAAGISVVWALAEKNAGAVLAGLGVIAALIMGGKTSCSRAAYRWTSTGSPGESYELASASYPRSSQSD